MARVWHVLGPTGVEANDSGSDPPPLGQVSMPTGEVVNEVGGAWSSYWYNGFIYESEITKGLNLFRLSDPTTAGAIRLSRLNPQTEEFSLP